MVKFTRSWSSSDDYTARCKGLWFTKLSKYIPNFHLRVTLEPKSPHSQKK